MSIFFNLNYIFQGLLRLIRLKTNLCPTDCYMWVIEISLSICNNRNQAIEVRKGTSILSILSHSSGRNCSPWNMQFVLEILRWTNRSKYWRFIDNYLNGFEMLWYITSGFSESLWSAANASLILTVALKASDHIDF